MSRPSPLPEDALAAGRLSQRCQACGRAEAAGWYCTLCYRPMGPDDWFEPTRSAAQLAGLSRAREARKRAPALAKSPHSGTPTAGAEDASSTGQQARSPKR